MEVLLTAKYLAKKNCFDSVIKALDDYKKMKQITTYEYQLTTLPYESKCSFSRKNKKISINEEVYTFIIT